MALRAAAAAALGLLGVAVSLAFYRSANPPHSDWTQIHAAAQAVATGDDPYAVVRHDGYPFYYPLTAPVLALPSIGMSPVTAQAAWAGIGTAVFAFMLLARGWWALLALASAPFLNAFLLGQWSPLLLGATAIPWLGAVWIAKPTLGLVCFAAYPSRRALLGMAVLLAVSLAIDSGWPLRWLDAIRMAPHIRAPVTRFGGVLLMLALLRWRSPAGRLLGVLALVPQTAMPYEVLPVFLAPSNGRQMGVLVVLSQVAFAVAFTLTPDTTRGAMSDTLSRHWPVWLALVYLPALAMVLRSRPPAAPVLGTPSA